MSKNTLELPTYLFHEGKNYKAYELLCPHKEGKDWVFRVWAPNAIAVSIVGDFNNWDSTCDKCEKISTGIWEGRTSEVKKYDMYKFAVVQADGTEVLKTDPFATHTETTPANSSKVYDISGYTWKDKDWITRRKAHDTYSSPMNIYEVHMGSWKRHEDGNQYSYLDLADELIPYVKKMGYTHIEMLPITEYPYDGSWGYQVTGFFAATSRFGTPHDLMKFIDMCHKAGIGVLLDWVVAHFPKDLHGLYEFDGTRQFEVDDDTMCEHKEWGTRIFDYSRPEVRSFLISSAMYWVDKFHIDGIRVDAVASMLYLDYNRKDGEWKPNVFGGNYNLAAIDFLKELNTAVLTEFEGVVMIAEESTAFPLVTKPADIGGLGFNYKWNMGWMNDMVNYVSLDPYFRKDNHNKVTFAMSYTYSENYILPISHDEVVHGKHSMIGKMPLEYDDKFDELKAFYGFMIGHPGKKLSFMGNEFGQFLEWKFDDQLDWKILEFAKHEKLLAFSSDLNNYYLDHPEMYEQDNMPEGFRWLSVDDNEQNIVSFARFAKSGDHTVVVVNFSPVKREGYKMGIPALATYSVKLDSCKPKYGGNKTKSKTMKAVKGDMHSCKQYITIDIEANSVVYLKPNNIK